jgi:hypothetical protein
VIDCDDWIRNEGVFIRMHILELRRPQIRRSTSSMQMRARRMRRISTIRDFASTTDQTHAFHQSFLFINRFTSDIFLPALLPCESTKTPYPLMRSRRFTAHTRGHQFLFVPVSRTRRDGTADGEPFDGDRRATDSLERDLACVSSRGLLKIACSFHPRTATSES